MRLGREATICTLGLPNYIKSFYRDHPFSLTYGMEAVLLIELEFPLLREVLVNQVNKIEWVRACYNELALLDEKRMKVAYHHQRHQKRIARAFNQKVKS